MGEQVMPVGRCAVCDFGDAVGVLLAGGLAVIPTDTVYGLCALASSAEAVSRIYDIKKRPRNKPMAVLMCSPESVGDLAFVVPDAEPVLLAGDTAVLRCKSGWRETISPPVFGDLADLGPDADLSIAVRAPLNASVRSFLAEIGAPVVATSVNLAGNSPAVKESDIDRRLLESVDCVVGGYDICGGTPSKIISFVGPLVSRIR